MSRAKKLHWRAGVTVTCAVVLLAVGLTACGEDAGAADTSNAALAEANAADSEAATALADAQAATAAAQAALRAAEAAQAAADLAQATAEGNQAAVAAAEAALADAQDAAAAARDEAAAAQAEADAARDAAEAAQAEADAQATAAAAAAEEPPPPPPDAGPVTISFLGFYGPDGVAPLLDAFHADNPGITVEYQSVPFGELNQVIQSRLSGGGESPDVYIADQPRVAALDNQGFLHDVTDAVGDAANDWVDTALTASTVGGRLMALPLNTSTQILYYNKTLLDQAGIPYPSTSPEDRMTWDELIDLARQAQEGGATYGFQFDQVSRYYQLQPLMESLGGGPGLTGPANLTPDLVNDGWIEAMEFYAGLFGDDGVAPRGMPPEETPNAFAAGEVAFYLGGTHWGGIYELFWPLDFDLGFAPHPYFDGHDPVTPTGALSLGVNPNSPNIEAATTFAKWVTTSPVGTNVFLTVDVAPPALTGALPAFIVSPPWDRGEGGTTAGELVEYELDNTSVVRPRSIGYIQFEEILGRAFEDIRNGLDVRETLERAQSELEAQLPSG